MKKQTAPLIAMSMMGVVASAAAVLSAETRSERIEHSGVACAIFAPGTPEDVIEKVQSYLTPPSGPRFSLQGSAWFGGNGTAGTLRYSFPPDGLNITNGIGEGNAPNEIHARLNALFAAQGGEPFWKDLFRQSFDAWSAITGIEYVEVTDDGAAWGTGGSASRGDVRIAMKPLDGSSGVLAYNQFPSNSDMVLDRSENWASGAGSNFRFFRNTIMHEHGHGLGFLHICPVNQSKLMEPFLSTAFDGLQHDDIRGGTFVYGDRFEPNADIGAAADLGGFGFNDSETVMHLSMRNASDVDVFAISVPNNARVSVTASPVGFTYNQAGQSGGSCPSGSPFDSLVIADLELAVLDGGGGTLESMNETASGEAETIADLDLPGPGTHYVRVSAASATGSSQIYQLHVTVTEAPSDPCPADLDGDGQVGASDVALLLGSWGGPGAADLDMDGSVGAGDLALMLGGWGVCP